jgi:hypothetical protein
MEVSTIILVINESLKNTSLITNNIGIKPFYLYMNEQEPYLDPVVALLDWIRVSQIKKGYLFHRINANDQVVIDKNYLVSRYPRY